MVTSRPGVFASSFISRSALRSGAVSGRVNWGVEKKKKLGRCIVLSTLLYYFFFFPCTPVSLPGDILLLVTDGLVEGTDTWVCSRLCCFFSVWSFVVSLFGVFYS